jgi:hypothetical protein
MDHILKYEKDPQFAGYILRTLSSFHEFTNSFGMCDSFYDTDFIEKNTVIKGEGFIKDVENKKKDYVKKGLAICHGHNHTNKFFQEIKSVHFWYMVDVNINAYPDYIANAADYNHMQYFPDKYFDCVLFPHCPIVSCGKFQYLDMLKNVHRILKHDGVILLTELPMLFFNLLVPEQYDMLVTVTDSLIGIDNIEEYKKQYQLLWNSNYNDEKQLYASIFMDTYRGPGWESYYKFLNEFALEFTKKILADLKFEYINEQYPFIICKPIN